jgi:outer membrane protein TolC
MRSLANFVLVFALSLSGFAQTESGLTYSLFLQYVEQNHPLAGKAKNMSRYGELQYQSERGNYDPVVNGSYDNKFFGGSNYYSHLQSEIKQPIFTSQFVKLGYEYGIGTNIGPENITAPVGLPYLGLEVGLLQGLRIDKRRADVLKSKEYVTFYEAEKNLQMNDLLYQSASTYFDWLFSIIQIKLNTYFTDLANTRLTGIKSLAAVGERPVVDTIEASIFLQTRLLDLQNAIMDNQKVINQLLVFSWNVNSQSTLPASVKAIDSLEKCYTLTKMNLVKTLQIDSINNPILVQYETKQNVLEIEQRLKREMIKPKLNVNYNFLSSNKTSIDPVFSNNNYKWGANLSFPIFFRNSINEYKMSKIQVQNNQFDLTNKNNEINFKIEAVKQNLNVIAGQVVNAERSALYSKQLVNAEKLKFENGESSLFMLNTRESKWLESELKLAEYKLKFMKAYLSIIYLKGNLNYNL